MITWFLVDLLDLNQLQFITEETTAFQANRSADSSILIDFTSVWTNPVLTVHIPPHNPNLDLQLVLDLVELHPPLELLEPQQQLELNKPQEQLEPNRLQEQLEPSQPQEQPELNQLQEQLEPKLLQELLELNQSQERLELKLPLEPLELPLLEVVLFLCLSLDLHRLAPTKHVVMHCQDPTRTLVWDIWPTTQVHVRMVV